MWPAKQLYNIAFIFKHSIISVISITEFRKPLNILSLPTI